MSTRRRASAVVLVLLGLLFAVPAGQAQAFDQNPVLFVHGIEGSGGQFESQAMRFMSNGYPADWIDTVDYNSTRAVGDTSEVDQQIDAKIAELQARTGKSQVDVIAHSLGTTVMNGYLTDATLGAQRRANVSHYINVDGQSNNPGVPTLAVWAGRGTPGRNMAGAQNVTIPNQTHVQTCTSKESFVEYYKFLTGETPAYDEPVRQNGAIEIAGRVLNFPENSGALGTTLEIWPVDGNGQRMGASPVFSTLITDNSTGGGDWGPVTVQSGVRYEFALVNGAGVQTLHIYNEPFVRSDYTLRLLQSVAIENDVGNRPGSASGVHIRYKELWGNQGSENDQLLIDGLNICTPTLCPISKQVNAFFTYDINRDGQTDLSQPDPTLNALPFITGADVFMRGSDPPDDTISLQLISRGTGPTRTLNIPNWDSLGDGFSIYWNDFETTISLEDYEHPIGASPLRVALVPAFRGCEAENVNGAHGAPLSFGSCNPPALASSTARLGPGSIGYANLLACNASAAAANCGQAGLVKPDLRLTANLRDVRCIRNVPAGCSPGADYDPSSGSGPYTSVCTTAVNCNNTGLAEPYCAESETSSTDCLAGADLTEVFELPGAGQGEGLRLTDTYSGAAGDIPATVVDTGFPVPIDCLATPSNNSLGSTCGVNTSANALVPGVVRDGDKAIWQLGEIQVLDSGPDGERGNSDDERLAVQGIYVP
jgi:lipase/uncharacterized protein/lipase (class 2)